MSRTLIFVVGAAAAAAGGGGHGSLSLPFILLLSIGIPIGVLIVVFSSLYFALRGTRAQSPANLEKLLLKGWKQSSGQITDVQPTYTRMGQSMVFKVIIVVDSSPEPSFTITKKHLFPLSFIPRAGDQVIVFHNPLDPQQSEISFGHPATTN